MDLRELSNDPEEALRAAFAGLQKAIWTAMPAQVTQDTEKGHVATVQPTIKREFTDPETGVKSYVDHPVHVDVPIHHMGGGGVTVTHPNKKGDEGALIYASRAMDAWFQSSGSQQPIDFRMHSLADALYLSGIRSVPRMLQQVAKDSTQIRSDDKKHVIDHHPDTGTHVKSADPSTAPASALFDPFTSAIKFFEHFVHPLNGIIGNATDAGTTHSHGVDHTSGAWMKVVNGLHSILANPSEGLKMLAQNGLHSVLAHPTNGASLNASGLLHSVLAHPDLGALLSAAGGQHMVQAHPQDGVKLSSSTGISFDTPSLSFPPGSISAEALDPSALSGGVGALGGDLSGTLPDPQVVGIRHVVGANLLPNAANDTAAAGLGVIVGALYRNGSVLCVRVA